MANPSDGWDWPYVIYVGRVWLQYTERELWKLTPRQFKAQLDVHEAIQRAKNGLANDKAPLGYIDQIPGW